MIKSEMAKNLAQVLIRSSILRFVDMSQPNSSSATQLTLIAIFEFENLRSASMTLRTLLVVFILAVPPSSGVTARWKKELS